MPTTDSPAAIVARFLKTNNYDESYAAFVAEAGLPADIGDASSGGLTLERLLEEKRLYDKSINFEKLNLEDGQASGWKTPAPTHGSSVSLPGRANILNARIDHFGQDTLIVSTADRKLSKLLWKDDAWSLAWSQLQDAPVLSHTPVLHDHIYASSMSGEISSINLSSGELIGKKKHHSKYVVSVVYSQDPAWPLAASAGWDNKINIYQINPDAPGSSILQDSVASISLATKPESIIFAKHPEIAQPILVITRTDSSHLEYWTTNEHPRMLGKQNLAPYSNAWVAFTPSSIAVCPNDAGTVAVATNSTPHMKVIVVRLLWPATKSAVTAGTRLEEGRRIQAITDRENEAILLHCNSMSAQTPYSTPLVVWRPDGQGVWVNSDDGIIRGIDTLSGKIVAELKEHEGGTKIRTLWSGYLHATADRARQEVLVSGAFDHKLLVWTI